MLMLYAYRAKLLFNIREKDVVDELEKMEGGGWHTLIDITIDDDGGSTRKSKHYGQLYINRGIYSIMHIHTAHNTHILYSTSLIFYF